MRDVTTLLGTAAYPIAFVFGALFGSFMNVIVIRIPEGRSIIRPRSRCPACDRPIAWFDNIPIVSFFVLRAKCRGCSARISIQYPLIELAVGVVALLVVAKFGLSPLAALAFTVSFMLIALSLIDLAHWFIPDGLSLPLIPLGLLAASLGLTIPFTEGLIGVAVGGGTLLAVSFVYYLARGVSGMGLGDVKLLAGIGALLGWRALPFVIFASALQGLVATAVLALFGKKVVVPDFDEPGPAPASATGINRQDATSAKVREESVSISDLGVPGALAVSHSPAPAAEPASSARRAGFLDATPAAGKRALPFGPFLSLAALEQLFLGDTLLRELNRVILPFP